MDWMQVSTIIAANFILFFWLRSESNSDRRELRASIDAIQNEIKDFHGRLCKLEEKYYQWLMKEPK